MYFQSLEYVLKGHVSSFEHVPYLVGSVVLWGNDVCRVLDRV